MVVVAETGVDWVDGLRWVDVFVVGLVWVVVSVPVG